MSVAPLEAPSDLRVRTVAMPRLGALYARGAGGAVRGALPGGSSPSPALPSVGHRVRGVRPDVGHLTAYQHLLAERGGDELPSGYLHVLAFPVATSVMVDPDFPAPLLGMVHLANRASLLHPVTVTDELEITTWTQDLRPHKRGAQLDVVAQVSVDGEVAWEGVSTYLAKGMRVPGEAVEVERPDADARADAPIVWSLPASAGRAYAAVSGDVNPIHMSALTAKAFGFPRAIAHGMYTAARALSDVGVARGSTYDWTVEFAKPVLLPGKVAVSIEQTPSGSFTYEGRHPRSGKLHLRGEVTPR